MIKALRWFFGLSWFVAGASFMADGIFVGGLLVMLAGVFVLPTTFPFIAQATGKTIGRPLKYAAVLLPLFGGFSLFTSAEDVKAAEKKKQEQLAYERLPPQAKDSLKRVAAREDSLTKIQKARAAEYAVKKGRKDKIEAQFSGYDGAHRGLESAIKKRMNDPDSYEHVSTRYVDKGDYLAILTQFRGKNAFGAKVLSTATGKVDLAGNVLEMQIL